MNDILDSFIEENEEEGSNHLFTQEQRNYIIGLFACYTSPSEVRKEVLAKWPELPPERVSYRSLTRYNPNTIAGSAVMTEASLALFTEVRREYDSRLAELSISSRTTRQKRRDEHWNLLQQAAKKRALQYQNDPKYADDPVLTTGLGVKRKVALGSDLIEEQVSWDTSLLTALDNLEEAAAQEMGQTKGPVMVNVQKTIIGVNLDDV